MSKINMLGQRIAAFHYIHAGYFGMK